MPIYTFHPCRPDGTSDTFLAIELNGDAQIQNVARMLMQHHPSCAWIEVWDGDCRVERIRPNVEAGSAA